MPQPNPVNTFLHEADELLAQIEEIALDADPHAPDAEAVNRLFRAFHTIKGSGAMFGFDAVAGFTHHVETVLDRVREGTLALSQELLDLVLAAKDQIKSLLDAAQGGPKAAIGSEEKIITALNALSSSRLAVSPSVSPAPETAPISAASGVTETFHISFRPDPGLMANGTNPVSLLNELRGLGECTVKADFGDVPPLGHIQPDRCYIRWDITLMTNKGVNAIKDVFIFVEDGSEISILPAASVANGESQTPVVRASPQVATLPPAPGPNGVKSVAAAETSGSQSASKNSPRKAASKDSTVRVPSEKLDQLVNLVGELVMNQSRLTQVAAHLDEPNLSVPVEEIERLIAELRDNVLGIRMMPIGATFSRFKRLVHDLSAELGKEIDLVTEGAETELDKTVLDQLGDPLIHLIRNSLDHGIEPGDIREQRGKPRRGTIRLAAAHTGSNVVVTIQDDGKGLDLEAIRAKAVEKKLITPDARLSDKETFNLIFLPGFSTAQQITSVSGRGVGMDVVKRQIDALRGSVAIASEVGKGTTISLTLPLTLAIIEGLLVEIGCDRFIVPMSVVTENVELQRAERSRNNGRNVIAVRGELVPYLRLRNSFGITEGELDLEKIVIVRHEDQRVGVVVDRVLGSHQTVIQSLGRFYRNIEIVSGATILGDGRVALILDTAGLVRFADCRSETLPAKAQQF